MTGRRLRCSAPGLWDANGAELEDVPTAGYWYDSTNIDDENIAPNLYD